MNLIVTGATGMVGSEVVRQALSDPRIHAVTAIVRRPLGLRDAKLTEVRHENFLDYAPLEQLFKESDACIWALGIAQSQVNEQRYREITFGYTLAAAETIAKVNPNLTFVFVSGAGADQSGKAWTLFGRVKGEAETALQRLGLRRLFIARPNIIYPVHPSDRGPWYEPFVAALFPILRLVVPSLVITSVSLARALIAVALGGAQKRLLTNADLRTLAAR